MTKTIKFKIQEDIWTCRLLSQTKYSKIYQDTSRATADFEKKIIDFIDTDFTFRVCIHEILHAYNDYLHLQDTISMDWNDITEILSTSGERNLLLVLEKSLRVYNKFSVQDKNKEDRELLLKLVLLAQKWA